jgi:hypothetical protein
MSKWTDVSEVIAGMALLHLQGRKPGLDPNVINPTTLASPYNEVIPLARDGMDISDISIKVGVQAVNAALQAATTVNGDSPPIQWLASLEKIASRAMAGHKLAPLVKAMQAGDEIPDLGILVKTMADLEMGYTEMTPMSEVKPQKVAWVKTGWPAWDDNFKGLPIASLTIVGASPGVGKTTALLKLAKCMIKQKTNKKKFVALFTLEMTMAQLTQRMMDLDEELTDDEKARILLADGSFNINEIYTTASRAAAQNSLCLIGIDFADQIVEGEQTESVMGTIYRMLAMLAKKTGVPIVLLSQLNRSTYDSTPKIHHIRYSGLAEAMAAQIILIYNPKNIAITTSTKTNLKPVDGTGYLIIGKSRYGYAHGSPGAVQLAWDGQGGWGDDTLGWFSLEAET